MMMNNLSGGYHVNRGVVNLRERRTGSRIWSDKKKTRRMEFFCLFCFIHINKPMVEDEVKDDEK